VRGVDVPGILCPVPIRQAVSIPPVVSISHYRHLLTKKQQDRAYMQYYRDMELYTTSTARFEKK